MANIILTSRTFDHLDAFTLLKESADRIHTVAVLGQVWLCRIHKGQDLITVHFYRERHRRELQGQSNSFFTRSELSIQWVVAGPKALASCENTPVITVTKHATCARFSRLVAVGAIDIELQNADVWILPGIFSSVHNSRVYAAFGEKRSHVNGLVFLLDQGFDVAVQKIP